MPLYALILVAFICAVYFSLKQLLSPRLALISALAVLAAPKFFDSALVAYANMPYSVFLILSVLYIFRWQKTGQKPLLYLGIILGLMSIWVRSFPFFLVVPVVLLALKLKIKILPIAVILASVALTTFVSGLIEPGRLYSVLDYIKWSVVGYYQPFTLVFLLVFAIQIKLRIRDYFLPLIICGMYAALVVGVYVYSLRDPLFYKLPDTIQRTFLFINPLISVYTIFIFSQLQPQPTSVHSKLFGKSSGRS